MCAQGPACAAPKSASIGSHTSTVCGFVQAGFADWQSKLYIVMNLTQSAKRTRTMDNDKVVCRYVAYCASSTCPHRVPHYPSRYSYPCTRWANLGPMCLGAIKRWHSAGHAFVSTDLGTCESTDTILKKTRSKSGEHHEK